MSLDTITAVLDNNLHPSNSITLPQLGAMLEMAMMLAFERKVTRDFYMNILDKTIRAISLVECLKAEVRMMTGLGLNETQVRVLDQATKLSMQEIRNIRLDLHKLFLDLKELPPLSTKLN